MNKARILLVGSISALFLLAPDLSATEEEEVKDDFLYRKGIKVRIQEQEQSWGEYLRKLFEQVKNPMPDPNLNDFCAIM